MQENQNPRIYTISVAPSSCDESTPLLSDKGETKETNSEPGYSTNDLNLKRKRTYFFLFVITCGFTVGLAAGTIFSYSYNNEDVGSRLADFTLGFAAGFVLGAGTAIGTTLLCFGQRGCDGCFHLIYKDTSPNNRLSQAEEGQNPGANNAKEQDQVVYGATSNENTP